MTSSPISRWSAEELREFHADLVRGIDPHQLAETGHYDEPPVVDEPPRRVSAGWVIGVILVALVVGVVLWRWHG